MDLYMAAQKQLHNAAQGWFDVQARTDAVFLARGLLVN
jgi:hypothetical protein